ncbi:glycosyltransferase family 4 protein [Alteromonas ponticola]|uniref:Glycosyltransferase family 4 protein n=1 Tax=Alteromonas aquimaris TaxID=2998417 RepID=A0ABT3P3B7_9ALTE|nr:glycosyltransferase family 4 protein [Alteromonas aquimaris]MCW8107259.1 glycosyltransferase family 4 protein [Alteromonas aquimaris]
MLSYFTPFIPAGPDGFNVLTIAGAFPTPIQPWLVNHLVEICRHGGDNRIISRREELEYISSAVLENELHKKYWSLPKEKSKLIPLFFSSMRDANIRKRTLEILQRYDSCDRKLKHKLVDMLIAPVLSLQPDIIHSHSEPLGTRLFPLIKANGAPFVQTFHGLTPIGVPTISREQRGIYSRAAKAIFVNTDFARRQYEAIGGESDNFIIVPQGIDLERWQYSPSAPPENAPLNLLTVGRLDHEKGHIYVLNAVANLLKKGFDVHYHIVGRGPNREYLQNKAKELGIANHVTMYGVLIDEQLTEIYRKSHIFILPSLRSPDGLWEETQGVVLQEAQATGLHVIACDSGGISECLDKGKYGFLVQDRNSQAIAQSVEKILANKSSWRQRQDAARKWVETQYSLTAIGRKMNNFYRQVRE